MDDTTERARRWANPRHVRNAASRKLGESLRLGEQLRRRAAGGFALGTFLIELPSPSVVTSIALLVLYGASLPATWSYVTFMKVESSSYLKIPMNWLFSIYVVFLVAILVRYLWLLWHYLRGEEVDAADPTQASSGL